MEQINRTYRMELYQIRHFVKLQAINQTEGPDDDEYRRQVPPVPQKPAAASSKPVERSSGRTVARIRPIPGAAAATAAVSRRRADRVGRARVRAPAGIIGG